MHPFRHRERRADPLWVVAAATQVLTADPETVSSLAPASDTGDREASLDGLLIAIRHPTGWFVHAVRRNDLPEDHHAEFRELVTVRSYVLLAHGPQSPAWVPSPRNGEWCSVSFSISRQLSELDDAFAD